MKHRPLLLAASLLASPSLHAALYYPSGVQFDVPVGTVTGGEWALLYSGLYGDFGVSLSFLSSVNPSDLLLYAAKPVGSNTFTLLAAAPASDVLAYTPLNVTTPSNGSEWYFNAFSIGFAKGGDAISQSSADILDSSFGSSGGNGEYRLSWHAVNQDLASDSSSSPSFLNGGWRAGEADWLNESTTWERFIFVAQDSAIPEPSSMLALGGLLGVGVLQRNRRKAR